MHTMDSVTVFAPLTSACLMAVLGTAVVTDLRSHKIPNQLVVTGTIVALALQMGLHGAANGTWQWATGIAAGLVPFVLLYIVRAVGAGDAKLMGCVGALTGPAAMPEILLATLLAGGVLALGVMLWRRESRRTLHAVIGTLLWMPLARHAPTTAAEMPEPGPRSGANRIRTIRRLPYAVAIASGVALVMTGVI
ncbi:A24 family peptidase [Cupriavidus pauculus]|uniref:Precorrin-2 dehydrogenase n=1 Tax=Cupriavidus pauculus TaxID=82633 RepID=A0A2N5CJV7_9BURK|nr:prepilin peptidase [Cupriavidus pauculus]PLQ02508.1 precorrin-2 dehydrogenase [Cupriavidus pauculus]